MKTIHYESCAGTAACMHSCKIDVGLFAASRGHHNVVCQYTQLSRHAHSLWKFTAVNQWMHQSDYILGEKKGWLISNTNQAIAGAIKHTLCLMHGPFPNLLHN